MSDKDITGRARETADAMCKAPLAGYTATIWPTVPELLRALADEVERLRKDVKGAEAERDAAIAQYERQWG